MVTARRSRPHGPVFISHPQDLEALEESIRDRHAVVGVVGQGYVGYGLAQRAAEVGFETYGLDVNPTVVERAARENAFETYLATHDPAILKDCDVILIAVPTPTREAEGRRRSDLSLVEAAGRMVLEQIQGDDRARLIVSESTYAPGTTRGVLVPILSEATGFDRIAVGYSPERIDPGNERFPLQDIPKVTSGLDATASRLTNVFYEQIVKTVVAASSMEAAEATKLLENTFRFVNIALAQEFDEYCYTLSLNSHEVTELAASKPFGFMPFRAGAGVGGHCIAEDPYFLYDSMQEVGATAEVLSTAMRNHDARPGVIAERVIERLGDRPAEEASVLVLGVSYKPNISDTRRSPSLPVMAMLEERGVTVDYHDPYVSSFGRKASVDITQANPRDYDLAVLLTEHSAFNLESLRAAGWNVYRLSEGRGGALATNRSGR